MAIVYSYLILCEKPSVARDIAVVLGGTGMLNRKDWLEGSISGERFAITWCLGHLMEAAEPHEYNPIWKDWSMQTLPIIPQDFNFIYKVKSPEAKHRLQIIKLLANQTNCMVNACDAGREGELIFHEVTDYIKWPDNKAERLWLNTTTKAGILRAWGTKQSASLPKYINLVNAARIRAQSDWLLGTNGTRAITLAFPKNKAKVWSVGRVQTAVLSIIAERDNRIATFIPEPYYGIKVKLKGLDYGIFIDAKLLVPASMTKMGKFTRLFKINDEATQMKARASFSRGQHWKATAGKLDQQQQPPHLFNLVDLQKYCSFHLKWTAKHTLDVAQHAYEQKLLTYPRTDARALPADYVEEADKVYRLIWPKLLPKDSKLQPHYPATQGDRKSIFNDKELTDHYAIVPTDNIPVLGSATENVDHIILWTIVAKRFLLAFCPPMLYTELQYYIEHEDLTWEVADLRKITGISKTNYMTHSGWTLYAKTFKQDMLEREPEKRPVPPEEVAGTCIQVDMYTDFSERPDIFREDTLLSVMDSCSLGTSATRAGVIETLASRQYISRRGTILTATDQGQFLIAQLKERKLDFITNAETTKAWELQLEQIEQGNPKAPTRIQFLESIKEKVENIIRAVGGPESMLRLKIVCPKTGAPVEETIAGFVFAGFKDIQCPKDLFGRKMTAQDYRDILRSPDGAGPFDGFISKRTSKPFRSKIVLNAKSKRLEFKFE